MGAPLDHHHLPSCHLGHQEVVQYFSLPKSIRSGGTPQFRGEAFKAYCKDNGILHETSSPYNPESNGLAEAAVKNVKKLLIKCIKEGTDFQAASAEFRNCPRADSCSPVHIMFRRGTGERGGGGGGGGNGDGATGTGTFFQIAVAGCQNRQ